jgi:CRP-like cAMP-binding protein
MTAQTTMELFADDSEAESFPAGHRFFHEGEHGDTMFVVIEGEAEIDVHGTLVETVKAGGIFGEMALIDHRGRSADVIAKTPIRVSPISEKRFLYLISNHPFFALNVMRVMADRLRRFDLEL